MKDNPSATTRERLKRELFEGALGIPLAQRRAYLEKRIGDDRELLDSVIRLLNAEATTDTGVLDFSPFSFRLATTRPTPLMFGPYRVLRRIGEGGMGAVFACQKDGKADLVAAKVIRSSLPLDEFRESFQQECRILTSLRHPNICHLIDAGIAGDDPFFIMDYLEGQPIDEFCRAGQLSIRDRLVLLTQVLSAIDYLHLQNVIHRDLKPSNIMVTRSGTVKILDFGIAKIASHASGMTGVMPTTSRKAGMTLRYASPEQLNRRLSGRSSDLYSVGVVAYELVTGHHPYARQLQKGVAHFVRAQTAVQPPAASIVNDPEEVSGLPRRLRELPIRLRGNVDRLLFKALATDASRRYRTATQFLDDVRLCIEDGNLPPEGRRSTGVE